MENRCFYLSVNSIDRDFNFSSIFFRLLIKEYSQYFGNNN
ncbi:hypothetical protein SAMN05216365_11816 [Porphyromonadaceae bacterium NLAE-zl-C104]|nr:hypothetical protein SAMN05216331_12118 [Porphyromonadaceae bacterium KH3R12]SFS77329.1 hypothetical protein SAMN05216365_11816 [Porphyromonadaceae bacterium NLAE-zl-C104]